MKNNPQDFINVSPEKYSINLELDKQDFKSFLESVINSLLNIDQKFYKFLDYAPIEQESYVKISKIIRVKTRDYKIFLREQLSQRIRILRKKYSSTILTEFFDILIKSIIELFQDKKKVFFLRLEEVYNIFYIYGFKYISNDSVNHLISSLQWNKINPSWLNYHFLYNYYRSIPNNFPLERKKKTWLLVELTRIKEKEQQLNRKIYGKFYKITDF